MLESRDRLVIPMRAAQRARPREIAGRRLGRLRTLGHDAAPERDGRRVIALCSTDTRREIEQQRRGFGDFGGGRLEAARRLRAVAAREGEERGAGDGRALARGASEQCRGREFVGLVRAVGRDERARRGEVAVVQREPSGRIAGIGAGGLQRGTRPRNVTRAQPRPRDATRHRRAFIGRDPFGVRGRDLLRLRAAPEHTERVDAHGHRDARGERRVHLGGGERRECIGAPRIAGAQCGARAARHELAVMPRQRRCNERIARDQPCAGGLRTVGIVAPRGHRIAVGAQIAQRIPPQPRFAPRQLHLRDDRPRAHRHRLRRKRGDHRGALRRGRRKQGECRRLREIRAVPHGIVPCLGGALPETERCAEHRRLVREFARAA